MPEILANMVQVHIYRLRYLDGAPEYLMLKRSPDNPRYPDVWQCVTGGIEPGEASPMAAGREVMEETGLMVIKWHILPTVSMFYSHASDRIVLSPTFGCQVPPDAEPTLSKEHSEYEWLLLDEAITRSIFPSQKDGMRQIHEIIVFEPKTQ